MAMASSQVDIPTSNPFGCILRDHNRRDGGCRETSCVRTPQTTFPNNLKDLVRTRVRTRSSDNLKHNNTTATTNDNIDSWIKERNKVDDARCTANPNNHSNRVCDRWASQPDQEEVSDIMSPPSLTSSPSPPKGLNRGAAASSLVQIWEARLGRSTAPSMASNNSRYDSPPRYNDNDETSPHSETLGEFETQKMDPVDEPAPLQCPGSPFGGQQMIENPRVADIIRRFVTVSGRTGNKTASKDHNTNYESPPLKERDSNRDYDCSIASPDQKSSSPQGARLLGHGISPNDNNLKGSDLVVGLKRFNISQCPRIRGRQALKDLLLLMERDRKKELDSLGERKPVSRFTHKGRIQSLLKLKIIQRGLALQNQWRPYSGSTRHYNSPRVSTSVNWREKIAAAKAKTDVASSSICQVTSDSKPNNSPISGESKRRTEEEQQIQSKKNAIAAQSESSASCAANQTQVENVCDETSVTSNARNQDGSSNFQSSCSATIDDTSSPAKDETIIVASNATHEDVIISSLQFASPSSLCATVEFPAVDEEPAETIFQDANGGGADSVGVPESVESCYGWYQEWTQLEGGHEDQDDDQNHDETLEGEDEEEDGYEWFLGVSRPRSYWENLRQSWYREVLETDSTNADIRQLLERRTVSNFLTTSDFQDRMNNMMMTHLEEQNHRMNEEEEDHSAMGSLETMRRFLSSYLQQQSQSRQINGDHTEEEEATDDGEEEHEDEAQEEQEVQEEEQPEVDEEDEEEEDEEEEEEEDEDEEMFMRRQERMEEVMSNCLQISSQDLEEESDADEDDDEEEEGGDVIDENEYVREDHDDGTIEGDSDGSPTIWRHNATHMPSQLMMRSWSCHYNRANNGHGIPALINNWTQFDSINRLSMEMEMINELRAQMKGLYEEMSELRRSISSCVDMQLKLQDSIKQEISSVQVERNNRSDERAPRKGYCCICYDMKVDSLLYRCGHMCTCLKCAKELQMGSGKCPMCRAPILDVVRAYSDS